MRAGWVRAQPVQQPALGGAASGGGGKDWNGALFASGGGEASKDSGKLAYAPATFEERGTVVPFTTPVISQARVRLDHRSRLEVLLPGFSDSRGIYVVNWDGLPQLVSMTVHDRMLHKEVKDANGTTPLDIRHAALKVAKSGIGGQHLAASARKALKEADDEAHLANLMLLVQVVSFVRRGEAVAIRDLVGQQGQIAARDALVTVAGRIDKPAKEVFKNAGELSRMVSPVGVKGSPKQGRIRQIFHDLKEFQASIGGWGTKHLSEKSRYANFCADTVSLTLDISADLLTDIDAKI